jgi:hypothetical protein
MARNPKVILDSPADVAEELRHGLRHETDEAVASDVACSPAILPPRASFTVETIIGKRFCVMVTELWT